MASEKSADIGIDHDTQDFAGVLLIPVKCCRNLIEWIACRNEARWVNLTLCDQFDRRHHVDAFERARADNGDFLEIQQKSAQPRKLFMIQGEGHKAAPGA